jgi:hypothetical protein
VAAHFRGTFPKRRGRDSAAGDVNFHPHRPTEEERAWDRVRYAGVISGTGAW